MLVCAYWPSVSWSGSLFPDRYDAQIKKASKRYLPGSDWRLLKAQYYQESRLDPKAESPVGAKGVGQFMPGTWKEVSKKLGFGQVSPHIAKYSIQAGAYYMARLRKNWSSPRPEMHRHSLALASYNAGLGNMLKAQKKRRMMRFFIRLSPKPYQKSPEKTPKRR